MTLCMEVRGTERPNTARGHKRAIALVIGMVFVFHMALLIEFVRVHHWDLSATVQASAVRAKMPEFAAITYPLPAGHDGQFYYLIAQAPLTPARRDLLDQSARHTRVLYPTLGWLLSGGGNPRALVYALPAVNLLAAAGLGWLGAWWAVRNGRPTTWGLCLPCALVPGIALVHDLTDAVAGFTLAALVITYLARQDAWVGPLALATLLAKEQNAAVVGLMMILALCSGRWRAVAGLALAAILWGGWIAWVWHMYDGESPFPPSHGNFAMPASGLWWRLTHLGQIIETDPVSTRRAVFQLLSTAYQIGLAVVCVWLAVRPGPLLSRGLAAGGAVLIVTAGQGIYGGFYDYNRVLVLAPFAVWLTGVSSGHRWMMWLVAPGALWAIYPARGWA